MKEKQKYTPTPEDMELFQSSLSTLFDRGASRDDIRNVQRLIGKKETWGLSDTQVAASNRVLQSLMSRPYLMEEDLQDIVGAFKKEKEFAYKDLPRQQWESHKRIIAIRRKVTNGLLIAASISGLYWATTSFLQWNNDYYSPDAVSSRQAADRGKLEAELLKNRKETVSLKPSPISLESWRIRYEPFDPNVDYKEISADDRLKVKEGNYIGFPGKGFLGTGGMDTDISLYNYKYADSTQSDIKLHVHVKVGDDKEFALRKNNDGEADTRVVVFEHINNDEVDQKRYLSIARMETESDYYKVIQMKKVPAEVK